MWDMNAMEGRGSAIYPGGQQYDGMFHNGRREGRGTIYFTNGAVYEGRFRDDAIDGQGTMKMNRVMVVPRPRKRRASSGDSTPMSPLSEKESDVVTEEPDGEKGPSVSKGASKDGEGKSQPDRSGTTNEDFMIPISFQSDMTHIHAKAGFTAVGH